MPRFVVLRVCAWILQVVALIYFLRALFFYVVVAETADELLGDTFLGDIASAFIFDSFLGEVFIAFVILIFGHILLLLLSMENHFYVIRQGSLAMDAPQLPDPQTEPYERDATVAFNRGYAAFRKGETDKALRYFSDALSADPYHVAALTYRSQVYKKLGEHELARRDMVRSQQIAQRY